jgi:hypothetical protein
VRLGFERGIEVRPVGSGVAVQQNPPPYQALPSNKIVVVHFGSSI